MKTVAAPKTLIEELTARARSLGSLAGTSAPCSMPASELEVLAAATLFALVGRLSTVKAWKYHGRCSRCASHGREPAKQPCRNGFQEVMSSALAPLVAGYDWPSAVQRCVPLPPTDDPSPVRWVAEPMTLDAFGHHGQSVTPAITMEAYRTGRLVRVAASGVAFHQDDHSPYFTCTLHSVMHTDGTRAPVWTDRVREWDLVGLNDDTMSSSPVVQMAFALLGDFDGDAARAWGAASALVGR